MSVIIGKGLVDTAGKALPRDPALFVIFIFKITAAVLVNNGYDVSIFIILIMGNALIRMHHIYQIIPRITVLGSAPNFVRDLQNVSLAALYLQHIT